MICIHDLAQHAPLACHPHLFERLFFIKRERKLWKILKLSFNKSWCRIFDHGIGWDFTTSDSKVELSFNLRCKLTACWEETFGEILSLLKISAPVWRCARRNLDGIFEILSKILPQLSIEGENEGFIYDKTEPHRSAYKSTFKRESGLT